MSNKIGATDPLTSHQKEHWRIMYQFSITRNNTRERHIYWLIRLNQIHNEQKLVMGCHWWATARQNYTISNDPVAI